MSLTDDDLIKIMDLLVEQINKNLETKQIKIRLNTDAAKYILEKTCGDRSYGARPLRRALQKYIEDPLSEALIQGHLPKPSELNIYLGEMGLYYRFANQPEAVPVGAGEVEAEPVETPGIPLYTF
jgi:ATP-dependent Clp protease ATP-binding subunit ClpC